LLYVPQHGKLGDSIDFRTNPARRIAMAHSTNQKIVNETDSYLAHFEKFERQAAHPAWLLPLRREGLASFRQQGFPTLQDEDWRFTNVAPISRLPFNPFPEAPPNFSPAAAAMDRAPFRHISRNRLVFIDGHYSESLSSLLSLPAGVTATSLAAAVAGGSGVARDHLGRYAITQNNAFAALNQAFFLDGAFIRVPAGVELADPIQLVFISSAQLPRAAIHPRNLVIAENGSKLTVIESYLGIGPAVYLTNSVTELFAGENAAVELLKFQDESSDSFHVATIQGQFGRGSNVNVHSFALGARLSRTNIRAKLGGEGLECILNGLYLTKDEQLADHHMIVEHAEPRCASHEYFNGILDDKSRGVFHGRIYVHQSAQKTDAKQTNKNLLLSDDATANTKPQLEIYADDVKCTHGATVGQLNEEAVFYLRSRGLGIDTARRMLIHAFAGEIIERVRCKPARQELDRIVWDRLEANPHLAQKT
jgi:Fe-S cluster assembly protein SufD